MGIFGNRIFRFILFRQTSQLYLGRIKITIYRLIKLLFKLNHKVKNNNNNNIRKMQ